MKLANGTTISVRPYQDGDAEEIVHLIIRNFKEIFGEVLRKVFY